MANDNPKGGSPSRLIDMRIKELGDWRGKAVEEWKWRGVPVWSHDGIICTGETYKEVVKFTFARGAALDEPAFKDLVRAAVALNVEKQRGRTRR